jgi:hypothetical protein
MPTCPWRPAITTKITSKAIGRVAPMTNHRGQAKRNRKRGGNANAKGSDQRSSHDRKNRVYDEHIPRLKKCAGGRAHMRFQQGSAQPHGVQE